MPFLELLCQVLKSRGGLYSRYEQSDLSLTLSKLVILDGQFSERGVNVIYNFEKLLAFFLQNDERLNSKRRSPCIEFNSGFNSGKKLVANVLICPNRLN